MMKHTSTTSNSLNFKYKKDNKIIIGMPLGPFCHSLGQLCLNFNCWQCRGLVFLDSLSKWA